MKISKLLLFTTILGTHSCLSQSLENNIVLINVGRKDRGEIAKEISIICSLNPSVVALDLQFAEAKGDSKDAQLVRALEECKYLVMPSLISSIGNGEVLISMASATEFLPPHAKTGFVSAKVEKENIQRRFIIQQLNIFNKETEYHFSVRTAMTFDSLKAMDFVKSNSETMDIDYKNGKRRFKTFSSSEVLSKKITLADIEGKIVMIGFLGPGNEDKIFTPLNTDPNEPDMYGLEYLANIVAQVLENR